MLRILQPEGAKLIQSNLRQESLIGATNLVPPFLEIINATAF